MLLAAPIIVGALGRIVVGALADTYGGKTMFVISSLMTVIPVVGLTFAENYSQLLIPALLLGTGGATFAIGIPFITSWFEPHRRGLALGIYSLGNIGTAVSGLATPQLGQLIGKDGTFLIVAGLLIAVAVTFIIFGRESPHRKTPKNSAFSAISDASRQSFTWDMSAIYGITFGAYVAFGVYLPVLLSVAYDLSFVDAAARAAGFVALATIARPVGGWLSDKFGGRIVIRIGLLALTILASVVAFQSSLELHTTAAYLSLAFVLGCCNGAVFAMIGKLAKPENTGAIAGIVGAIGGLGGFLPPLILGLTYQQTQSYAGALIMLALSAALVLIYISRRFAVGKLYASN